MTKTQMLKRFGELGGKTEVNAIQITIEKYVEMMAPEIMEELFRDGLKSPHDPFEDNCGLCYMFMGKTGCPLRQIQVMFPECGGGCCVEWYELTAAIEDNDEAAYLAACQGILDKLKGND